MFVCINKNHDEIPIKKADVSITNVHRHIISEASLPVAYSSLLETIVDPVAEVAVNCHGCLALMGFFVGNRSNPIMFLK